MAKQTKKTTSSKAGGTGKKKSSARSSGKKTSKQTSKKTTKQSDATKKTTTKKTTKKSPTKKTTSKKTSAKSSTKKKTTKKASGSSASGGPSKNKTTGGTSKKTASSTGSGAKTTKTTKKTGGTKKVTSAKSSGSGTSAKTTKSAGGSNKTTKGSTKKDTTSVKGDTKKASSGGGAKEEAKPRFRPYFADSISDSQDAAKRMAQLAGLRKVEGGGKAPGDTKKYRKATKSPYTADELAEFRQELLAKRREILGDVSSFESEALGQRSGGLSSMPQHLAEQGSDLADQSLNLGLAQTGRTFLKEVEDAIERIDKGVFGICELLGKPIKKARLQYTPWARYSIEAARMLEENPYLLKEMKGQVDDDEDDEDEKPTRKKKASGDDEGDDDSGFDLDDDE